MALLPAAMMRAMRLRIRWACPMEMAGTPFLIKRRTPAVATTD
jgi:hypothetical protein